MMVIDKKLVKETYRTLLDKLVFPYKDSNANMLEFSVKADQMGVHFTNILMMNSIGNPVVKVFVTVKVDGSRVLNVTYGGEGLTDTFTTVTNNEFSEVLTMITESFNLLLDMCEKKTETSTNPDYWLVLPLLNSAVVGDTGRFLLSIVTDPDRGVYFTVFDMQVLSSITHVYSDVRELNNRVEMTMRDSTNPVVAETLPLEGVDYNQLVTWLKDVILVNMVINHYRQ